MLVCASSQENESMGNQRSNAQVVSPRAVAAGLDELFAPRVIGVIDDTYVKVARVHGSLAWHTHEGEDEAFLVLRGHLTIEMEDRSVELDEGDLFVVKKGVRHNPVAKDECHILLIERSSTLHTGDVITDKTRSIDDQLRPLET
jgi:mannose-6-phosphate isomerase-like protein (cupin superfamily)